MKVSLICCTGSLRSKRFRGVFCTKKPIFVFLDAREMGRERKHGGGGRGEEAKVYCTGKDQGKSIHLY